MYESIRISSKEAIELANTSAFDYLEIKFYKEFTKFKVYGSYGAFSNIFGTLSTAVFLTYGSSSLSAALSGSTKYSFNFGTLNEPIVLTAKALIIGLALLDASLRNKLIDIIASSGRTLE